MLETHTNTYVCMYMYFSRAFSFKIDSTLLSKWYSLLEFGSLHKH